MHSSLKLLLAAGMFALSSTAMANPYYHHDVDGSWTNAEYNDGICHYSFSRDASDGETHVNRWGDCSHIAIGPNGEAIRMVPAPVATGAAIVVPDRD